MFNTSLRQGSKYPPFPNGNFVTYLSLKALIAAAMGALLAVAAMPLAFATESPGSTASDETPPFAIEELTHPGADSISATKGIELKKGDGHILLAEYDCAVEQITVLTVKDTAAERADMYCFRATGATGYRTLTLPRYSSWKPQTIPSVQT
ncbi:hypothetical protein AB0C61_37140 [Streptomyces sp. NPDC048680]|uniref:hypothetical protein n=1 Tax=Streptomyces sp. NPDC048680 TaxID=3155492 RepID=UPI00343FA15C